MNFDELQQNWKNEPTENVEFNKDIDLNARTNTMIEELKEQMRKAHLKQIYFIILPSLINIIQAIIQKNNIYLNFFSSIFIVLIIAEFIKYYRFFKKEDKKIINNSQQELIANFYSLKLLYERTIDSVIFSYPTMIFIITLTFYYFHLNADNTNSMLTNYSCIEIFLFFIIISIIMLSIIYLSIQYNYKRKYGYMLELIELKLQYLA